jgi:hypothetical protein
VFDEYVIMSRFSVLTRLILVLVICLWIAVLYGKYSGYQVGTVFL